MPIRADLSHLVSVRIETSAAVIPRLPITEDRVQALGEGLLHGTAKTHGIITRGDQCQEADYYHQRNCEDGCIDHDSIVSEAAGRCCLSVQSGT